MFDVELVAVGNRITGDCGNCSGDTV